MRTLGPGLLALTVSLVASSSPLAQSGASRWGRDYFPNCVLTNQDGQPRRFFDDLIGGKVVAINFIYTSCKDSCPLETARLGEVQELLRDRIGKDVFFYSISIDPERDTPEVLKDYAERYGAGPGWEFLTGKEEDITLLRKKLGLYIADIQNDSNDHNLSLIIGNQASGVWMKSSPFENPYVLASKIGDNLSNWKGPRPPDRDYANAPELRDLTMGESLFRTRCAACHVIGIGPNMVRVGPNLMDVTERRERDWLERWLAAPDQMLADGDPIASSLFANYKRVPMPNLRLQKVEIDALLEFLGDESTRIREEAAAAEARGEVFEQEQVEEEEPPSCCQKMEQNVIHDRPEDAPVASDPEPLDASELALARGVELPAPEALEAAPEEAPEGGAAELPAAQRAPRRRGLSTLSLCSIGLGLALGLVTAVLGRRSSMPRR